MHRCRAPADPEAVARGMGLARRVALSAAAAVMFASAAAGQTTANLNSSSLLSPFLNLLATPELLTANLQDAISINNNSTTAQRNQAVIDNNLTLTNGGVIADGLGTSLNQIYQNAITNNSPLLSADSNLSQLFTQANGIATSDAAYDKLFFSNATLAATGSTTADLRPFQVVPGQIENFAPTLLAPLTDNPALPSGNSTVGYTDALLFAVMVPDRYQQLLTRAAEYGNSRIVLGAHSPLDIIAGRIVGTYDVAQLLLDNPAYLNQTVSLPGGGAVTTSSNFTALFNNASSDLNTLVQQGCGGTAIATCAGSGAADRFSNTAQNKTNYIFELTYGLPSVGPTNLPPVVPAGAEVLLATRFPYLGDAQLRDVLATTELPSGLPLDNGTGWARLDLYAAADGYGAFNSTVVVSMNASLGGFNALDTWNNDIGGAGGLTLGGSGTLVLTGADTYTGPTVINGGTLVVNGSIASSVLVNPGATLRGTGTLNAPLVNNGTVAPGYPGGTLSVNAGFTQGPSGTLQTQLDQSGATKLLVSGTATLDGALRVTSPTGFTPGFGQTFSVLGASQGISGTFATVTAPVLPGSMFYQPLYTPQGVGLITAEPLASFAATANQRAVAQTLDQLRGNPDPGVQNILSALYPSETSGGVPNALDRLAPQSLFSQTLFGQLFADVLANQFAGRAAALRAGASGFSAASGPLALSGAGAGSEFGRLLAFAQASPSVAADSGSGLNVADSRVGGFVSGQIAFGDRSFTPGQSGSGFSAGGVTLGLDYRVDPSWAIGAAGSYFTGDPGGVGGSTDARGGALSLYGTTLSGPLFLDGFAGFGITGYNTARNLNVGGLSMTASAAPSGHFVALGGDTGYRFEQQTGRGLLRWGPVGTVQFDNVAIDGYSETGFASLSSRIRARDATSVQSGLGAEAALDMPTALGVLTPYLRATWRHEFADTSETAIASFLVAPALPFALTSSPLGRDFASIAAGVSGRLAAGVTLSADYAGMVGRRNETVHQLSLIARITF